MRGARAWVGVGLALAAVAGGLRWQSARHEARLSLGGRLYREGLGADGAPVKALVKADLVVDGTMMTCSNCHLRAGYGSFEGRLVTPPIVGEVLFSPVKTTFKGVEVTDAPLKRPAYTLQTLARAIRDGVDPTGRALNEAMPHFALTDEDVAVLAEYLNSLSVARSAGVTDETIRLATVVSDGVPSADRAAMLFALEKYVAYQNAQTQPLVQGLDNRSARMSRNMMAASQSRDVAFKELKLDVWEVTGPEDTWASQLERFQRKTPVFALVGGLVRGPWAPVARFADAQHLPTLLPVTDLPELDPRPDGFTVYASMGAYQEGAELAASLEETAQVVEFLSDDPLAQARRQGFEAVWSKRTQAKVTTVSLPVAAPTVPAGGTAVVWDAPGVTAHLEALARANVGVVYGSAVALGPARATLTADLRPRLRLTWPARVTTDERLLLDQLRPWLKDSGLGPIDPTTRAYTVAATAHAAMQTLANALMDLRGHYTGDALLDVVAMEKDQRLPHFERLSFGVGQRFASKGVWLVEVDEEGEFVKRSEWLTH